MKTWLRITLLVALPLAVLCASYTAGARGQQIKYNALRRQSQESTEKSMLEQINLIRDAAGQSPLTRDARLDVAARAKVNDIVARKYWSHKPPTGGIWDELQKTFPGYRTAGENLAMCAASVTDTVTAWRESPGHYRNMIGNYSLWGTASAESGDCTYTVNYFVMP